MAMMLTQLGPLPPSPGVLVEAAAVATEVVAEALISAEIELCRSAADTAVRQPPNPAPAVEPCTEGVVGVGKLALFCVGAGKGRAHSTRSRSISHRTATVRTDLTSHLGGDARGMEVPRAVS